jgi:zinc and cadmium transporter
MVLFFLSLGSVIGVSLLSLLGIAFFLLEEKTVRGVLLYAVSFSTGAMLGDVFIHILPDMAAAPDFNQKLLVVLFGIVFSFAIEKIIHWRHCHAFPEQDHDHHHDIGIMSSMGESVHNFIDGVVIAASFMAGIPIGISTTLAVVFHEIPHEIGNFAVLLHSGFSRKKAVLFNALSAGTAIIGTLSVFAFSGSHAFSNQLLPFAAGNLLYIAGSDLIPELHKETLWKKSVIQLLALIAGMGLMYLILKMEG